MKWLGNEIKDGYYRLKVFASERACSTTFQSYIITIAADLFALQQGKITGDTFVFAVGAAQATYNAANITKNKLNGGNGTPASIQSEESGAAKAS